MGYQSMIFGILMVVLVFVSRSMAGCEMETYASFYFMKGHYMKEFTFTHEYDYDILFS